MLVTLSVLLFLQTEVFAATPVQSYNIHAQNQIGYWASPIKSYLVSNDDGTYTRVECVDNAIACETYTKNFKLKSTKKIKEELGYTCGFYAGENYNYVVFGQDNREEDDDKEVFRIVQYTKKWKRVQSASLFGADTTEPVAMGTLRMSEYGDYVYVHTCHKMYKTTSDGLRHQANLTFCYNSDTGKITQAAFRVGWGNLTGYVSHSFNQFIQVDDDGTIVALDHGDGYPRAIAVTRYVEKAGQETFINGIDRVSVKGFAGSIGQNYTGASVGGFEISGSRYLVAYKFEENIYLGSVSKKNFSSDAVKTKQFTKYTSDSSIWTTTPTLVKISDDKFVLMWELRKVGWYLGKIRYVVVDGNGKKLTSVKTVKGLLSDCQPIVRGSKVIWYASQGNPVFYKLDINSGKIVSKKAK
jgi:hypothetical protein